MRFRYTIKDADGNHWQFDCRDEYPSFRAFFNAIEGMLSGRFSGGELVEIKRLFRPKEKHAPIPDLWLRSRRACPHTERIHQGETMRPMTCREALQLLLDQVDFERGACSLTDMVGQCIPAGVLAKCREAVAAEAELKHVKDAPEVNANDFSHLMDLLKDIHKRLSETDALGFVSIDANWREEAVENLEEVFASLLPQGGEG